MVSLGFRRRDGGGKSRPAGPLVCCEKRRDANNAALDISRGRHESEASMKCSGAVRRTCWLPRRPPILAGGLAAVVLVLGTPASISFFVSRPFVTWILICPRSSSSSCSSFIRSCGDFRAFDLYALFDNPRAVASPATTPPSSESADDDAGDSTDDDAGEDGEKYPLLLSVYKYNVTCCIRMVRPTSELGLQGGGPMAGQQG